MPAAQPSDPRPDSALRAVRRWVTGTLPGRFLAVGLIIKLVAWVSRVGLPSAVAERIDTVGDICLLIGGVLAVYFLFTDLRTVLLWRVRRKLTLSYIFIGFVPALLIIVLFITAGTLLFFTISEYMTRASMKTMVDQAEALAQSAAVGLQGVTTIDEARARLERRAAAAEQRFPFASYAVVPTPVCVGLQAPAPGLDRVITAGRWSHVEPPATVPWWTDCTSATNLTAFTESVAPASGEALPPVVRVHVMARAVAWADEANPAFAVVVDIPLSNALIDRMRQDTGISLGALTASISRDGCRAYPLRGRQFEAPLPATADTAATWNPLRWQLDWVAFMDYVDWDTARVCQVSTNINLTIAGLYARVADSDPAGSSFWSPRSPGENLLGQTLLVGVAVIAVLFLIIQVAAFMMGFALARSITGAIHELFAGTERVRRGEFTHKIVVHTRDQLGELAESFNSMTSSIEDLLHEKAEKERMEQELRIARNIQMSLLPHGGITMPGLSLTAHCEPAREVGGDYYDYMALSGNRLGLLVADVAGKGTSAALYMAELKGLMLSLTELHTSPRRLLMDANRIICRHLDTRSFITITYAVVDMDAGTLTYARAGHCPLIYVPGPYAVDRTAQILAPDGLVLGLQIDNGERFDQLLVESSLPIGPGDVFLFFTDGLTEAMDRDGNCFGDTRLATVVQQHADLPSDELRERILREIGSFSTDTDQQDDMTMLLLKVEHLGSAHVAGA